MAANAPIVWSRFVTRNDGGDASADIVERAIGAGARATDQIDVASPDCIRKWVWKNGLDRRVWVSTVSPSGELEAADVYGVAFPTGCRATGVYLDAQQVFLVPQPGAELEAVRDLYDCCLARESGDDPLWVRDAGRCARSVSPVVCSCFPAQTKYAPAVWIRQEEIVEEGEGGRGWGHTKGSLPLQKGGAAWLMHHWTFGHHPDHFNMKMLEYHGLFTTRCATPSNAWVPRDIVALVSLDYPLNRSTFTDYEETVMGIIEAGVGIREEQRPMLMTMSAAEFSGSCYASGANARVEAIRGMCHGVARLQLAAETDRDDKLVRHMGCQQLGEMRSPHCSTSTHVLHLDKAFWSPNYNKNIPLPQQLSRATLRRSIQRALDPTWLATQCGGHGLRKQPRVSVMRRVEGQSMRRWLNEEEVLRAVAEETGVHAVRWMFPNSKTPALEQFGMFCGFDILLTPHSSQLANLWFANPGSSVIEVQGRRAKYEKSFIMLSDSVNLHHQVLRGNDDNGNNDGGWSTWDHVVDIHHLRAALRRAMQNLRKQGIIGR